LIKNNLQQYYLAIPEKRKVSDNQANESMIFLDPGVKNFVVGYDPSGKIITWGKRDSARIARLLHYKRKLHSKIDNEKNSKRRKSMQKSFSKT
jgi:hypothetical protein